MLFERMNSKNIIYLGLSICFVAIIGIAVVLYFFHLRLSVIETGLEEVSNNQTSFMQYMMSNMDTREQQQKQQKNVIFENDIPEEIEKQVKPNSETVKSRSVEEMKGFDGLEELEEEQIEKIKQEEQNIERELEELQNQQKVLESMAEVEDENEEDGIEEQSLGENGNHDEDEETISVIESLKEFKLSDLKDLCSKHNLSLNGSKAVLIKRLLTIYNSEEELLKTLRKDDQ